jgi:hypothetical protein
MATAATSTAALFPDARFRSPTAVSGQSDLRDENVYSSFVAQHSGNGVQNIFVAPSGQSIPTIGGTSSSPAQVHQQKYSDLTTNLAKAGELGSALGDAQVRAIGVTLENAAYTPATGVSRIFGATQFEVADILSKTAFEFKIGGKRQVIGALNMFPAYGGAVGTISTTGSGATAGIANNGFVGMLRRLKIPIMVARNDQIQGVVSLGNGASYAFSNTAADGQPVLVWVNLHCSIKGDVR